MRLPSRPTSAPGSRDPNTLTGAALGTVAVSAPWTSKTDIAPRRNKRTAATVREMNQYARFLAARKQRRLQHARRKQARAVLAFCGQPHHRDGRPC